MQGAFLAPWGVFRVLVRGQYQSALNTFSLERMLGLPKRFMELLFIRQQLPCGHLDIFPARQGINAMAEKVLKISDKIEKRLNEIAKKMEVSLKVGFMSGAVYPETGTPVASVAFLNEFGHGGIYPAPPRPFFRNMIANESPGWGVKMSKLAKVTNYDGQKVMSSMGEDIKGALKQSITDFTTPELAESTKKAKGFDKPLIDSSHMENSITYEVK